MDTELFVKIFLNALYDIPKLRFRYISSNTRIKNSKIPGNHIIMTSYWRFAKQDWVAWCQQKKHEWVFSLVFEKARTFNVNNLLDRHLLIDFNDNKLVTKIKVLSLEWSSSCTTCWRFIDNSYGHLHTGSYCCTY